MTHRLVVLLSGSGTNLQAIIEAIACGKLNATVAAVISNKREAGGLDRAQAAGIPVEILSHRHYDNREAFDHALIEKIDRWQPDTVVLAGFMRILSPLFVQHYSGQLLNIHPSLLPRHKGLDTHQRVLQAGDREHGCSIHFVTEELDGGPLIAKACFPVAKNDSAESLSKRVQWHEHRLYSKVLSWRATQRLVLSNQGVFLDEQRLPAEGMVFTTDDLADVVANSSPAGRH